ncbi:Six-hairpin glycosidase [Gloeophyllum trabeum ATCC 11539]|uniref:Six-hairpin glycosidase n=1 Tax=Gloeophyllum trabeum (strain ATCC 11539 / FP-39264 / Madison 617) TaxID=670483 RepID=S7RV17_GLOTA|nr:Six-hairpin glycosidase [Gloeophyllum trabeum ATCC 11539]EPQ57054.1 Six-hairpin glycosidase [Gloeophyllum trabeum ATCC 11539]
MLQPSRYSDANRIQSQYWDPSSGLYNTGEIWTDAVRAPFPFPSSPSFILTLQGQNAIEDLQTLMLATNTDAYAAVAEQSYIGQVALDPSTDWAADYVYLLDGSNDDSQWIMLAMWRIADYKAARGEDASPYNNAAAQIYDIIATQWDDVCGGGVWWSSAKTYKNAITNELFLLTSAMGYLRSQNQTYLDNANKEWAWLSQSGMRNAQGLFNDGLDSATCANNGQTAWTYNQAVVAAGLGALGAATRNASLFDEAEVSLDAAARYLTQGGVLKESCDGVPGTCDADQEIFKGIFTKHLTYYLAFTADPVRKLKYLPFLGAQYTAVTQRALNASTGDVASAWYARESGGGEQGFEASTSGLEACLSAAVGSGEAGLGWWF